MKSKTTTLTVKPKVNQDRFLQTAHAYFSTHSWLKELWQNAYRSGATRIECKLQDQTLEIHDNGQGIDNWQNLLSFLDTGWDETIQKNQSPAGMGMASFLSQFPATIHSGNQILKTTPEGIKTSQEIPVTTTKKAIQGTKILLTLPENEVGTLMKDFPRKETLWAHTKNLEEATLSRIKSGWVCYLMNKSLYGEDMHIKLQINGVTFISGKVGNIEEHPKEADPNSKIEIPLKIATIPSSKNLGAETEVKPWESPRIKLENQEGKADATLTTIHNAIIGQNIIVNYYGYQLLKTHETTKDNKAYPTAWINIREGNLLSLKKPDRSSILLDQKYADLLEDLVEPLRKAWDKAQEEAKGHAVLNWYENSEKSPALILPDFNKPYAGIQRIYGIKGEFHPSQLPNICGTPTHKNYLLKIPKEYLEADYILPACISSDWEGENFEKEETTLTTNTRFVAAAINEAARKGKIKIALIPMGNTSRDFKSQIWERLNNLKNHPVLGPKVREVDDFEIQERDTRPHKDTSRHYGEAFGNLQIKESNNLILFDNISNREIPLNDVPLILHSEDEDECWEFSLLTHTLEWENLDVDDKINSIYNAFLNRYEFDPDSEIDPDEEYSKFPKRERLKAILSKQVESPKTKIESAILQAILDSTHGEIGDPQPKHTFHLKKLQIDGKTGNVSLEGTYQDPYRTIKSKYQNGDWNTVVTKRTPKKTAK